MQRYSSPPDREPASREKERETHTDLSAAASRFHDLVGLLTEWVWETDVDGRFTFASAQVHDILGYLPAEIIGLKATDLMPIDSARSLPPPPSGARGRRDPFRNIDRVFLARAGNIVLMDATGAPIFDPAGTWVGYRGVCRDVTATISSGEQAGAILAEAVARADHDSLTGLLNRRAFQDRLDEEIRRAARTGQSFSIVLTDVDNFKFFNEAYGHLAGDDVLRLIAQVVRSQCRPGDAVARLGGDEFAVLLPGLTRRETEARMTALCENVSDHGYRPEAYAFSVPLGISCGVAVWPDDAITGDSKYETGISSAADALISNADKRLYKNKMSGRDMWSTSLRDEWKRSIPGFEVLDGLIVAVHLRDRYTLRHAEDVLLNSILIGQELGLSMSDLETLQRAAMLHDIGMIGVPERYLRRPGLLSDAEFESVKLHAAMGAAIVCSVPDLDPVLPAIRHHHERWAGGGYPSGISECEIPLHARIVSVADAFSAMTSDRPFRVGLDVNHAKALLEAGSGTQWDPICVAAFLRAHPTGKIQST